VRFTPLAEVHAVEIEGTMRKSSREEETKRRANRQARRQAMMEKEEEEGSVRDAVEQL